MRIDERITIKSDRFSEVDREVDDTTNDEGADDGFSLTDEQEQALDLDRNVAITAGAGTGKTTTLKERYRHILQSDPSIGPMNLVTITFTRNAAAEMRTRIREVVDEELADSSPDEYDRWRRAKDEVDDAYVHTIHGFCSRILREFAVEANVHPDFKTLDETDAKTLVLDVSRDVLMAASDEGVAANSLLISDHRLEAIANDVRRLAELYSREKLSSLLRGLVSEQPESDEWADSVLDGTQSEYIEATIARASPFDVDEANTLAKRDDVQEALRTIAALAEQEFDFTAEDDDGRESLDRVANHLPADTTVDRQQLLLEICDIVTSNSGSVYSQSHYYAGSATRWRNHGRGDDNQTLVAAFDTLIDALDPESRNIDVNLVAAASSAPYVFALARLYRVVRDEYEERKTERNSLDYSDLIKRTVEFLETDDQIRRTLCDQFEYVMVDEVQDTDPRQWDLVQLLTGSDSPEFDGKNVFLVGDEKQSIYRFRRADVTMFRRARDRLTAANPSGTDADEQLSGNFRTLPETLAFINDLFDRVFEPEDGDDGYRPYEAKPQRLTAERPGGVGIEGSVEYLVTPEGDRGVSELNLDGSWFARQTFESTAEREATTVAARLTHLFDDPPMVYDRETKEYRAAQPSDVALLFRTKTRLRPFERAFEEHAIPYPRRQWAITLRYRRGYTAGKPAEGPPESPAGYTAVWCAPLPALRVHRRRPRPPLRS